jgi:glycosyltransferase involved in cell wall biosynthesis
MACGCACVSCKASEIPYYIEHGKNGFLAENDHQMRMYLEMLLGDEKLCKQLGEEARKTVIEKCSVDTFVTRWDTALRQTAEIAYKG